MALLWKKGLLRRGRARALVSPFFVHKKTGYLRLIFDTRASNEHFHPLPYTALSAGASLAGIECGSADDLFVDQGDIEVCFYQCRTAAWLHEYFVLPPIRSSFLPKWLQKALKLGPDEEVSFLLVVIPMGWSWAVWLVQTIVCHLITLDKSDAELVSMYKGAAKLQACFAAQVL